MASDPRRPEMPKLREPAAESRTPEQLPRRRVNNEGFTVLSEGVDPVADIIFVHGLQGHPEKTWTYGTTSGRNPNPFSKFFSSKSKSSPETRNPKAFCFWPDLLASEFKNTRIATYGYDSRISKFFRGPANQTDIAGNGRSLLHAIEAFRRNHPERPIIFIVHLLGGLVLKDALRRSWQAHPDNEADLRNVYASTIAIIFMGTPHRGSPYAPWGVIAQNIAVAAGFDANDRIVRALRVDSSILELLREDFAKMLDENMFDVFTFQEANGLKGVQGLKDKVVEDFSSSLDHARERKDTISANHRDMCRFSGLDDNGYRKIVSVVSKCLESPRLMLRQPSSYLHHQACQNALKSLELRETGYRIDQVDRAEQNTFEWLFKEPELGFKSWLEDGRGLYWIRGKPASGKSTLMKMAYNDPRTKKFLDLGKGGKVRAAFFFHDRGSEIQKSFEGLLHSVLHQILSDLPVLLPLIVPIRDRVGYEKELWSIDDLQRALTEILSQKIIKADICLFLDALDEYSGSHESMAKFLNQIVNTRNEAHTRIKVCFSSRPLQIFLDRFHDTGGFDLHAWTAIDIEVVIDARMRDNARMLRYMQSSTAEDRMLSSQFANEIASKAEGVFLWVRLVLDELLDAFTHGETLENSIRRLTDLPTELEEYYRRILERLPPRYHTETRIMFEALLNVGPTNIHDFIQMCSYAENLRLADCSPCDSNSLRWTNEDLLRLIRVRGGGLIEAISQEPEKHQALCPAVQDQPPLIVQLIHQTVKSFIRKPRTLGLLSSARSTGFHKDGFLRVKYNLALIFHYAPSNDVRISLHRKVWVEDLFKYARFGEPTSSALYADLYEECGDTRIAWLFDDRGIVKHFKHVPIRGLLPFAVVAGIPFLLKELLERDRCMNELQVPLIHLAVHKEDFITTTTGETVRILLEHEANLNVLHDGLTPFQALWEEEPIVIGHGDTRVDCVLQFLRFGQDPNQTIKYTKRPKEGGKLVERQASALHQAARWRDIASMRTLLAHNANVNFLDSEGRTPLNVACNWGADNIWREIQELLPFPDESFGTKLLAYRFDVITTLLDNGGKRAYRPQPVSDITDEDSEDDCEDDEERHPITEETLQALSKRGIHADRRLLDLPRLRLSQPSWRSWARSMVSPLLS